MLTFSFPQAVEKVRQRQSKNIPDVSIADEPLVLTQSDMDRSNFGVDTAGRPVILDFGVTWTLYALQHHMFRPHRC
jgi:hypothetical protein